MEKKNWMSGLLSERRVGIACYNEFDPGKTQRNCVAQRLKPKLQ